MADPHSFTVTPTSSGLNGEIADGTSGQRILINGEYVHLSPTVEELYNRAALAIDALTGRVFWRGDMEVKAGGTDTVFEIVCGPVQAYTVVDDAGGNTRRTRKAVSGETLGLSDVESAPSALSPSSVYYVYMRDTGIEVVRQISTTQPVGVSGGLYLFKGGDARWVLIGAFVTDTAGAPIPYRARNGQVLLRKGSSGVQTDMHALTNGNNTSGAAVSLAGLIPPYVRQVKLMVKVDNTTPATGYVVIGDGDDDTVADGGAPVETPSGVINYAYMDVALNDSQEFQYHVNASQTRANVWVIGWNDAV